MANPLDARGKALEDEYFRRQEKELIEKMRAKMAEKEADAAALKCPKCEGTLIEVDFEGVKIDLCDKCGGAWLDPGDLESLTKKDTSAWLNRLWGSTSES